MVSLKNIKYSFRALNFLKGKCNSSGCLIILVIVPAVSFLLYKKIMVAFSPHFLVRKKKLSIASSLFEEEDIFGGNIIFNLPECIEKGIYGADIICSLPECIKHDTSSADIICNHSECIKEDVSDTDIIGKLPECIKQDISGLDIICNLPECIKQKILVSLSIKEAVKTSILSKDWRYTWTTIPDLVIDCNIDLIFFQNNGDHSEESTIVKFVNQLFSCHKGNLHKFKLSGLKSGILFTSPLMRILPQKHISELILEACPDKYVYISGISFCLKLKVLELTRCCVCLPLEFDGFRLLHTIYLKDCSFLQNGISKLLSFCPLLEKLNFQPIYYEDEFIQIHAPNLRELTICGKFVEVSLLAPNLCTFNVVTTSRTIRLRGNFIKLPAYINDILCHGGFYYFLQIYPPSLNYLTTMIMILEPSEHRIFFANESLRKVLMLQKLIVYLEPIKLSYVSNAYKIQDKRLPCLREATIIPFLNSETIFDFVEFILSSAPLLERLTIRGVMTDYEVSKLNEISKLSTKVEIIFTASCFKAEGKFEGCCCSMCDIVAW